MTTKLAEVGKKVSAANQAKIRTMVEGLMELLDAEDSETGNNSVGSREAVLPIGPVQSLADVKRGLQALIDYISNPVTREQMEGDGDGDGNDKDKDGNEGAQIHGAVGQQIESATDEEEWNLSEAMKSHPDHADNFKAMKQTTQAMHLMKMHGVAADGASLQVPAKRFAKHNADHAAAADDAEDKADGGSDEAKEKESAEFIIASDFIPLVEKAVGRDGTIQIKMIGPGWGSSGYYAAELLEKDGPKAFPTGTKMFWNHPTDDEERQRPERDLRDLAAVTVSDAKFLQEGPSGPGLYAQAKPISTYAPAIEELAPYIGTSILASGRGRKGEAEGKKGTIVESIISGRSCDFVTVPGAKGEIVQLFESVRNRPTETNNDLKEVEADVEELREAQKRLREVEADRDRLQVRILIRDAQDMAHEELSKVENLPVPTVRKLAETLSKDPPADEDGELDRKAFRSQIKEAVRKEAEYIESIVGSGRVRGVGRSNDNWDNENTDDDGESRFAESSRPTRGFSDAMTNEFARLGLSDTVAKEAAAGRR